MRDAPQLRSGRSFPRLAVALLVVAWAGAAFNLTVERGAPEPEKAVIQAPGISLEAVVGADQGLTHDIYYVYALLRDQARGGTVVIYDRDAVFDDYLLSSALQTIAGMNYEEQEYDPGVVPSIDVDATVHEINDVYVRRVGDDRREFRLIVSADGRPVTLVFFPQDAGFVLIDRRLVGGRS